MNEVFDYCLIAECTDVGCKRSVNEDWLAHFVTPNGLVAVICDGMGGHVGGKVASHTAVEAIQQFTMRESPLSPQELIVEAIRVANDAVLYKASQQPELKGMGATCVMLIVRKGKVYIGSVGDSRIYLNRGHTLRQLTKDQSFVQTLVDAGAITPEQAETHPRKNEITNAIGLANMQPATVLPEAIVPDAGDCFLLCSDGLSGMVSDKDICKIVSRKSEMSQQARVDELVSRAKKNGGLDNITCQLVEFPISPNKNNGGKWWKNKYFIIGTVILAIVAMCMCAWAIYKHFDKPEDEATTEHSAKVTELINTVDSTCYLKPLIFKRNYKFLELREHNGLGVDIRECLQNGQDTIVHLAEPALSLKNMEVWPDEQVEVKYNPAKTQCYLTLKNEFTEREVSIVLRDEKGKSYQFLIIIDSKTEGQSGNPISDASTTKKGGTFEEKEYTDENIVSSTERNKAKWDNPDYTIVVNKLPFEICINPKDGKNYDRKLNYNVAIKNIISQDWFTVESNNGLTCLLKVTSLPQNAIIKIPVMGEDSNGNTLEEIVIRLKKQK